MTTDLTKLAREALEDALLEMMSMLEQERDAAIARAEAAEAESERLTVAVREASAGAAHDQRHPAPDRRQGATMSDPIRDAMAEVVRSLVRSCVENGVDPMLAAERAIGAQAVLTAYDQAKFAHGDTTDANTTEIRIRRPKGKKP